MAKTDRLAQLIEDLREGLDALDKGPLETPGSKRRLPITAHLVIERGSIIADNDRLKSAALHAGGSRTVAVDDEDMPIVVNDPTGEYAAGRADDGVREDEVRKETLTILRRMAHARKAIDDAQDAMVRAMPKPGDAGEPGCRVEARWDGGFVAARDDLADDLCDWCYRFKAAYGCDPPEEIARARIAGKRISEAFIKQVLAQERARKRGRGR